MKGLLYIIVGTLVLTSCLTLKEYIEVPVETVKTEYIQNTKRDSIYVRDSIDRVIKGDTVIIYKEKHYVRYINKIDTIVKVDSVPKYIKKEVVRQINYVTKFQQILMWIGGVASIVAIAGIILKLRR